MVGLFEGEAAAWNVDAVPHNFASSTRGVCWQKRDAGARVERSGDHPQYRFEDLKLVFESG